MDFAETVEHQALRKTVAEIAGRFGVVLNGTESFEQRRIERGRGGAGRRGDRAALVSGHGLAGVPRQPPTPSWPCSASSPCELDQARAGGGPRYAQRHHDRGRLLARERIELLLDRDAPFLELSALAAWGTEFTVGAGLVTGIGVVSGVECVLVAHDPTVRGGSDEPVLAAQVAARPGDRPPQPAAGDQPGRVGRRRPADPVRPVRPGREDLPRPDRAVRDGRADHRAGLRQLHRRRRVRARACATTPCWWTARPRCSSAGRRWSRWRPGRTPTTRNSAAPGCTRGCPGWPTTSPPTSGTRSGSAAGSSPS